MTYRRYDNRPVPSPERQLIGKISFINREIEVSVAASTLRIQAVDGLGRGHFVTLPAFKARELADLLGQVALLMEVRRDGGNADRLG